MTSTSGPKSKAWGVSSYDISMVPANFECKQHVFESYFLHYDPADVNLSLRLNLSNFGTSIVVIIIPTVGINDKLNI